MSFVSHMNKFYGNVFSNLHNEEIRIDDLAIHEIALYIEHMEKAIGQKAIDKEAVDFHINYGTQLCELIFEYMLKEEKYEICAAFHKIIHR